MHSLLRQSLGARAPNRTGASALRKMKDVVWPPGHIVFLEHKVVKHTCQIGDGDTFAYPAVLHLFGRIGPDLKIVLQQKDFRDSCSKSRKNPLLEIRRLVRSVFLNFDESVQATNYFFARQPVEIVLKWVRNEPVPDPNPRFAFVRQPFFFRDKFVHQRVKVLVMRKLDVPSDVPEKAVLVAKRSCQAARVIVRFQQLPVAVPQLVKTPGGAEPSWSATEYENLHE